MNILNGRNLTPFEWSMTDELSASPMEFVIRLCCVGKVDIETFNEAIAYCLKQQPLLQANAEIGPTHRASYWRTASNMTPVIQWLDGNPTIGRGYPDDFRPIDLGNEIGFRFYGWQFQVDGESRIEMKFVFHHACCDGKAGVDFAEHVLCQYERLTGGTLPGAMPSFALDRVLDRNSREPYPLSVVERIWRTLVVRPKRVANMFLTSPRSLCAASGNVDELFADPPRQCSATLDSEATRQLGVVARSLGATTNVVLARELFHVLNKFLNAPDSDGAVGSDGKTLLRMLIPFSLREEKHHRMPAANCVSMAYLETKQSLLSRDSPQDPVVVVDLVKQVAFIRKWQLHFSWIESIESYSRFWPLIRILKRLGKNTKGRQEKRQVATTVLSNLGRTFGNGHLPKNDEGNVKVGAIEVTSAHLVLPCNELLKINFSVNFYGNRLTLDVSYLPSVVTPQIAQGLLDAWKNRILKLV